MSEPIKIKASDLGALLITESQKDEILKHWQIMTADAGGGLWVVKKNAVYCFGPLTLQKWNGQWTLWVQECAKKGNDNEKGV